MIINSIKRRLFNFVVGDLFLGITDGDFLDYESLSAGERTEYLLQAKEVNKNEVFQAELLRLRYALERRIIRNAKSDFDILVGKAQLLLIDQILKRFEALSKAHDIERYGEGV